MKFSGSLLMLIASGAVAGAALSNDRIKGAALGAGAALLLDMLVGNPLEGALGNMSRGYPFEEAPPELGPWIRPGIS